jgi:hypothetical protein
MIFRNVQMFALARVICPSGDIYPSGVICASHGIWPPAVINASHVIPASRVAYCRSKQEAIGNNKSQCIELQSITRASANSSEAY